MAFPTEDEAVELNRDLLIKDQCFERHIDGEGGVGNPHGEPQSQYALPVQGCSGELSDELG
jgi:hypothetical protein